MNRMRHLALAILAAFVLGCGDEPTSPARTSESAPIDRLFIYARDSPSEEEVEFMLTRNAVGESTVILFRPAREGRPRVLLDSIGPAAEHPEQVREMLASFDVWALNAPNAPHAACRTVNGERDCDVTWNDYSVVMLIERGDEVRVQRYTGLETGTGSPAARGLGDFVLAWARELDSGEPAERQAAP